MATGEMPPPHRPGSDTLAASTTAEPRVRLRLRASRDSGRTWGQVKEVREDEDLPHLENPGSIPPCTCLRYSPGAPNPSDSASGRS